MFALRSAATSYAGASIYALATVIPLKEKSFATSPVRRLRAPLCARWAHRLATTTAHSAKTHTHTAWDGTGQGLYSTRKGIVWAWLPPPPALRPPPLLCLPAGRSFGHVRRFRVHHC